MYYYAGEEKSDFQAGYLYVMDGSRISLDDVNQGFDLMHHQDGIRSVIQFS